MKNSLHCPKSPYESSALHGLIAAVALLSALLTDRFGNSSLHHTGGQGSGSETEKLSVSEADKDQQETVETVDDSRQRSTL